MDYLKDIYTDFFDNKYSVDSNTIKDDGIDINSLYITDESKELLKRIISYMEDYQNKDNIVYIPIRLVINTNSNKTIKDVIDILLSSSKKYLYTKNNDYLDYSLYKINNTDLTKYGIVNITELSGINLEDDKTHKKLIHDIDNIVKSDDKVITIISGNNDSINNFFLGYEDLKNNYFNYSITGVSPSIQDIYNNIVNSISISDELGIKMLDYITKTYNDTRDYYNYQNELIKYISFNKDVPLIELSAKLFFYNS